MPEKFKECFKLFVEDFIQNVEATAQILLNYDSQSIIKYFNLIVRQMKNPYIQKMISNSIEKQFM